MNQIQPQRKSQSEFLLQKPYTDAEIKTFQKIPPFTLNLISEKHSELVIVGQLIHATAWKQKILSVGPIYFVMSKHIGTNPISGESVSAGQVSDFQKFLLSGPVMTDEQYNYVQEKRKHFNEWK